MRPLAPSFFYGIATFVVGVVFLVGWWQWLQRWGDALPFLMDTDDLLVPSLLAWAVGLGMPFLGARMMAKGWEQSASQA
ncbi:MAG: hypothetical protein AABY18_10455 [Candidatus Thermoplasmatota archaeon]|mgnify:CR=1 FL=1